MQGLLDMYYTPKLTLATRKLKKSFTSALDLRSPRKGLVVSDIEWEISPEGDSSRQKLGEWKSGEWDPLGEDSSSLMFSQRSRKELDLLTFSPAPEKEKQNGLDYLPCMICYTLFYPIIFMLQKVQNGHNKFISIQKKSDELWFKRSIVKTKLFQVESKICLHDYHFKIKKWPCNIWALVAKFEITFRFIFCYRKI